MIVGGRVSECVTGDVMVGGRVSDFVTLERDGWL